MVTKLQELEKVLEGLTNEEKLDLIHFLRIKYQMSLMECSAQSFSSYRKKIEEYQKSVKKLRGKDPPGVYCVVTVDLEGNIILYPGKTSGKSETSGLGFRLKDHGRFLAKTPLTIFVPNWWIKRVYPIPLEEPSKAKELEEALWEFVETHVDVEFSSLEELMNEILKIMCRYVKTSEIATLEIRDKLEPKKPFLLKAPPAGSPRRF